MQQFTAFAPTRTSNRDGASTFRSAASFSEDADGYQAKSSTSRKDTFDEMMFSANMIRVSTPQKIMHKRSVLFGYEGQDLFSEEESDEEKDSLINNEDHGRLLDEHGFFTETFHEPPLDWGIKTRMRISSEKPFTWCDNVSANVQNQARNNFLQGNSVCDALGSAPLDMDYKEDAIKGKRALRHASLQWIHPAERLDLKSHILNEISRASVKKSRTQSEAQAIEFMQARRHEWEKSFRSIYYMCRTSEARCFYYVSQRYTVLFLSAEKYDDTEVFSGSATKRKRTHTKEFNTMRAIISKSTEGFRSLLAARRIKFSLPLHKVIHKKKKLLDDDDSRDINTKKYSTKNDFPQSLDNTSASLVFISGRQQVHKLFDLLLNSARYIDDVPLLFAPVAFLNASLKALTIEKHTTSSEPNGKKMFGIEIQGPIFPHTAIKLMNVFHRTQGQFLVTMSSETESGSCHFSGLKCHTDPDLCIPQLCEISNELNVCIHQHSAVIDLINTSRKTWQQVKPIVKSIRKIRLENDNFSICI